MKFPEMMSHFINLVLYSGAFIGICAGCITAVSFSAAWQLNNSPRYMLFIALATAALYTFHRVIGLNKLSHINNSHRLDTIRQYKRHIVIYGFIWTILAIWCFIPLWKFDLIQWLLPGMLLGALYVFPVFPGRRRIRDLGWGKIVVIAIAWGWLTAFIPLYNFVGASWLLSTIHGLERAMFIFLITIPFEIRDIDVDQSVGLRNLPTILGRRRTFILSVFLAFCIVTLALFPFIQFYNLAYTVTMGIVVLISLVIIRYSYRIRNDYFFSGLTDGVMILALLLQFVLESWL